eukprot:TRINITY_DN371_c0_g1_i1.p1 TRINITY_DN371_c0_g1~~TRINITY_DN371_c0_g1_i1.p1  ORF type:complete len:306 (+),score=60.46 TRINITY_DN371_c0_g1_i1:245-1162(+)
MSDHLSNNSREEEEECVDTKLVEISHEIDFTIEIDADFQINNVDLVPEPKSLENNNNNEFNDHSQFIDIKESKEHHYRWVGIYGGLHIIFLIIGCFWVVFSSIFKFLLGKEKLFNYKLILVCIGMLNEMMLVGFQAGSKGWKFVVQNHFPFHVCGFLIYTYPVYFLVFPHQWLGEYLFFWSIMGAAQALLTPAKENVEVFDFRFISFFISHFYILNCAVFSVFGLHLILNEWCWLRFFIFANIQIFITFFVNLLLGSNYMFLMEVPATPNPLMKGTPPFHILRIEPVALVLPMLIYAPFKFTNGI